ncbi:MAG: phosphatidate cytidylyltransferase [Rhodoferax sp.]|nr:phosphatidate cytidylyltransferase [Rhodoferax sp.]
MLAKRVVTAVILLFAIVPSLIAKDPRWFAVVLTILVAAGCWEWGRLNQIGSGWSALCGVALASLCLVSWHWVSTSGISSSFYVVGGVAWVIGGAWVLYRGAGRWLRIPAHVRLALGFVGLWTAWNATLELKAVGAHVLFSVLCLVWFADTGAYFAGRSLGGRWISSRLAPTISPGKTWEGVAGAVVSVLMLAVAWGILDRVYLVTVPSLFTRLAALGPLAAIVLLVSLVAMSVVGDLFESLVKRGAGVKDSSGLLPGHGGILDRLDALLPTMPLALLLYRFVGSLS